MSGESFTDDHDEALSLDSLAVIGAGKMGRALISALVQSNVVEASSVFATRSDTELLDQVVEQLGVVGVRTNREAAASAEVILLCVKPQVAGEVLAELRPTLQASEGKRLLVSIVAGLSTAEIEKQVGDGVPVVRAMPNTPSRIGKGMTAVCGGRFSSSEDCELACSIFSRIGRSLILEESYLDAVTGLSASGPAFLYIVIEAMAEGGVKAGLPRRVATELAAQTCLGAASMVLETGDHPAQLKDEVTTPAGCTVDGILKLEEGGLRVTLIKAIVEASRRAAGLAEEH